MDWKERSKQLNIILKAYKPEYVIDTIITKEKSMLSEMEKQNEIHESNTNQLRHVIDDLGKDNVKAEEEKKELIEAINEIKAELAKYGFKKTCKAIDQLLQKYSDKKEGDK